MVILRKDNGETIQVEEFEIFDFLNDGWKCDKEILNKIKIDLAVKEIEDKTTQFIKNLLDELDYDNEGEVALYAANSESKWHDEAVALQKYIEDMYRKMYELQDKVRAGEEVDLENIEANYPKFEFEEETDES